MREELRMEDIQNQTEGNRLRWFGHVKRMDKHKTTRRLLEMKMTGKRPRGKPQTWWLRPSQDRHRKKRMILGEGRRNTGIDR
jgi:hypothetical protein